jgi:hypothetical protein
MFNNVSYYILTRVTQRLLFVEIKSFSMVYSAFVAQTLLKHMASMQLD